MHTILVTGAAGFIGSHLAETLLQGGHRVIGIDNFDATYDRAFKEANLATFRDHPNFEFVEGDIRDRDVVKELFARTRPTHVAHLAAKADTRSAVIDPYPYIDTNITGTLHIFEEAKEYPVHNTVFVSSSSVYGNDTEIPWKESAVAAKPLSPYGATKRSVELLAHTYHHNFGMNITCLRYFNAYGERNRPGMVPYLWGLAILQQQPIALSGDGSRRRDYTYVGDTVDATIKALFMPLGYEIINIGNHSPLSLRELLVVFEQVIGTSAIVESRESHSASVESTYADVTKAKELLGWEPTTSIAEGIEKLVAWLRSNRL